MSSLTDAIHSSHVEIPLLLLKHFFLPSLLRPALTSQSPCQHAGRASQSPDRPETRRTATIMSTTTTHPQRNSTITPLSVTPSYTKSAQNIHLCVFASTTRQVACPKSLFSSRDTSNCACMPVCYLGTKAPRAMSRQKRNSSSRLRKTLFSVFYMLVKL